MTPPRARRGLTLIEILIVVVVMAVLAGIAIARFQNVRERAFRSAMGSDLRAVSSRQEIYHGNGYEYTTSLASVGVGERGDDRHGDRTRPRPSCPGGGPRLLITRQRPLQPTARWTEDRAPGRRATGRRAALAPTPMGRCPTAPRKGDPSMSTKWRVTASLLVFGAFLAPPAVDAQEQQPLGFFITSVGLGNGADLGGLAGADAHCQALAQAAGAGDRTWRAYLSTQATGGQPAVNARDRIGSGPWFNAAGLRMATNVDDLHYNNAALGYEHSLNEKGETINSAAMGDAPNQHDVLTGTQLDGTAFPPGDDRTCSNWTSSGEGSAMLGHHDRFSRTTPGSPWNQAHPSQGCAQPQLEATGGAGLFYCFAAS